MHERTFYEFMAAATVATVLTLLPNKENYISACEKVMSKLPAIEYEMMCQFVHEAKEKDSEFWALSNKVRGLCRRVRTSYLCLMLVQAFWREGHLNKEDAREMWFMFAGQLTYTALSIPEAMACRLFKGARHIAAKESVRFYCDLVIATNVKCYIKEAPLCVMRLPELL